MQDDTRADPFALAIFGASGDLTFRKLVPAVYRLFLGGRLPERFALIGIDRKETDEEALRRRFREGVELDLQDQKFDEASFGAFIAHFSFFGGELRDEATYRTLGERLGAAGKDLGAGATHIFYLATPPALIEVIPGMLAKAGLAADRMRARIVVEKPFGHDLESARSLNGILTAAFREDQIFRIDHYLGKETVQNILAFRFANSLFEPIWDRRYISHVQITVAEEVGAEKRGGYYEHAGALRDMVQNHLLQVLRLTAMEAPVNFSDEEIRSKKVDLLRAIRPIPPDQVPRFAVRGQYGPGWVKGERVPGYRAEESISPSSVTETFAAVKFFVDSWRWQGVPFYLRTGKRFPARISEVSVHFRPAPHQPFPRSAVAAGSSRRSTTEGPEAEAAPT